MPVDQSTEHALVDDFRVLSYFLGLGLADAAGAAASNHKGELSANVFRFCLTESNLH